MPSDTRLIPGIGNGHVATQVYSDTIYISNVYNGYTNSTHRARIPSTVGITVTKDDLIDRNYTLDMRRGDQLSFAASVISSKGLMSIFQQTELLIAQFTTIQFSSNSMLQQPKILTSQISISPIYRQTNGQTSQCTDTPMLRQPSAPIAQCSSSALCTKSNIPAS